MVAIRLRRRLEASLLPRRRHRLAGSRDSSFVEILGFYVRAPSPGQREPERVSF